MSENGSAATRRMMVIAPMLDHINEHDAPATREQLANMYRIYVCAGITDDAIMLMREMDLRRYVALGAHSAAKDFYPGDRHAVLMRIIAKACGVAVVSIYQWVAAQQKPKTPQD